MAVRVLPGVMSVILLILDPWSLWILQSNLMHGENMWSEFARFFSLSLSVSFCFSLVCLSFFQKEFASPSVWVVRGRNRARQFCLFGFLGLFLCNHYAELDMLENNNQPLVNSPGITYEVQPWAIRIIFRIEHKKTNNRETWWKRVRTWRKTRGVKKTESVTWNVTYVSPQGCKVWLLDKQ